MSKNTFTEDDWDEMMEDIQIRDNAPFNFLALGYWLVGIGIIAYVSWKLVRKVKLSKMKKSNKKPKQS